MNPLDQTLRQLAIEACCHPPGSVQRQRCLTQIIRLVTPKLWRESKPYYADALQQTWLYFCRNLCEGLTGEPYDPNRSSVITWLNAYLKRRLQDGAINVLVERSHLASPKVIANRSGTPEDVLDPVDNIPAQPDMPPMLDSVRSWAEKDESGELRCLHIDGNPDANCQALILRRLPPETSWKELSADYGLAVSTLSSFYQRKCLPRLRNFGQSEGYL